jgi:hypothetical protein
MSFTSKRCWRGCRWIWQGATGSGDMGQSLAWPPRAQSQPRPQHAVTCETLQRAFGDALQARVRRRAYDARNAKFTCRMVGKVGPAASVASVGVCAALIPWLEAFSVSKRCARARRFLGQLRPAKFFCNWFDDPPRTKGWRGVTHRVRPTTANPSTGLAARTTLRQASP